MSKSAIKEKSEPNNWLVYIYAVLMAFFGALLGFIFLMSFPLEAYPSLDDRAKAMEDRESSDPAPGDAFYIEGPTLRTRSWESKRTQLLEGSAGTLTVTIGEINAWFGANFRSSGKIDDEAKGLMLVPDVPNLGVSKEGIVYLSVPCDIKGYGFDDEYVISAQVSFTKGAPVGLKTHRLQVAGAAIPLPGILGSQLVSSIINGFSTAEEFAVVNEAWQRVDSVEVIGDALVLTFQP